MPKTQSNPIGNDFSAAVMQLNLHDHIVRSTFPAANDGVVRDIVLVDTGSAVHICIKTSRGWFKTAALSAV
jgi:hypothetical protein